MNNHKDQCHSIADTVLNTHETSSKSVKNDSTVDGLQAVVKCEVNQSEALDIQPIETISALVLTFA